MSPKLVVTSALVSLLMIPGLAEAARGLPFRDGLSLSRDQILALGNEGYYRRSERGHGLNRPEENEVWNTYADIRRERNRAIIRRMPRREQSSCRAFDRDLSDWEGGLQLCAQADIHSASIDGYIYNRSLPRHADMVRDMLQLRAKTPARRTVAELEREFRRTERLIRRWRKAAANWRGNSEAMAQDSLRLLHRGFPDLTRGLGRMRRTARSLSARLQTDLAAHARDLLNLVESYVLNKPALRP